MPLIEDRAQPDLPGIDIAPVEDVHVRQYNGDWETFDAARILGAVRQAFRDDRGVYNGHRLEPVDERRVQEVTEAVGQEMLRAAMHGQQLHAGRIRDAIEMTLMEKGFFSVARRYILSRRTH